MRKFLLLALQEYFETGYKLELTILMAILVVYLVLSAQFESFRNPLIIILTVPITMTAGIYALFVTGTSLNVYSQIGFNVNWTNSKKWNTCSRICKPIDSRWNEKVTSCNRVIFN